MKKPTLLLSLVFLITISLILIATHPGPTPKNLPEAEFLSMMQSNLLANIQVFYPARHAQVDGVKVWANEIRGTYYKTDPTGQIFNAQGLPTISAFVSSVQLTPELEQTLLSRSNISVVQPHPLLWKLRDWFSGQPK